MKIWNKFKNFFILLRTFIIDIKEFSFSVAIGRLVRDLPFMSWDRRRTFYEQRICKYLKRKYTGFIYKCLENYDKTKSKRQNERYIWVMWWQGEDSMPPIVKACFSQLNSVANSCKVVLLTKDNLDCYISLPQHVIKKFESGKIQNANFSDIIRCCLLNKYGGVWLDATVWADRIPEEMFDIDFYTLSAPGMFPEFINRGRISTFVLASKYTNAQFFYLLETLLTKYWEEHSKAIDYLYFNFFIELVFYTLPELRKSFYVMSENRDFYWLNLNINKEYVKDEFMQMMEKSPLQKVTYRKELILETDNRLTNYGYITKKGGIF